jgi:glycosyltransferase involved in cell wall biosynthesis
VLDTITPVLLTLNEAPNIARTLATLGWARDIVVVDSGSADETLAILAADPRVRVFNRAFDSHAGQWRFAVEETGVASDWILRMDADYLVTDALRDELAATTPPVDLAAYRIRFGYAMYGHRLLGSLYPANTVLFRRGRAAVFDKGHTEGWRIDGPVAALEGRIVHDDRKPMAGWVGSQVRYMVRELPHLKASGGLKAWLRKHPPLMPVAMFFYTLFGKGLIFNGRAGIFYALQRVLAETTLALMVLEDDLKDDERK